MKDLEQLIVENTEMNLEEAREYLHALEMSAWQELGAKRREGGGK